MAIPVYLQQFKAAGVYRVVFDKSTVSGVNSEILRLVVGYSEKGPFNIPTYVKTTTDFKAIYGDISKKLEKRGVFFHRLALQALGSGPILALNLKKFKDENVSVLSIDSKYDSQFAIEEHKASVKDIYNTERFWELDANKLIGIRTTTGQVLDNDYIIMSATDALQNSCSVFIRKAPAKLVSQYNVSVNDWYANLGEDMPEYLESHKNCMVSDFFAEMYVFKGKFAKDQVLASESLKKYFSANNEKLVLKPYITDAYDTKLDTLETLFADEAANGIGHYVGSLVPYFKDSNGSYAALDITFNSDIDNHHMMMAFNTDKLEEGENGAELLDLSGKHSIGAKSSDIFAGTAKATVLGNIKSVITSERIGYSVNYPVYTWAKTTSSVSGSLYVASKDAATKTFVFRTIDQANEVSLVCGSDDDFKVIAAKVADAEYTDGTPFGTTNPLEGPRKIITSIARLAAEDTENTFTGDAKSIIFSLADVNIDLVLSDANNMVCNPSVSFIELKDYAGAEQNGLYVYSSEKNDSLVSACSVGDVFATNSTELAVVQSVDAANRKVVFSAQPKEQGSTPSYLVRINASAVQEIGSMSPYYMQGYDYQSGKPAGTTVKDKLDWQHDILSVLEDKGLRTGLLNKSDIDYRYIIDTFESFVEAECKNKLSYLAKEKESALAILNFPAIRTFVKCPYSSFTDSKGVFNVQYVVDGHNKKKASSVSFSLPSEGNGASYAAFYTPVKLSDGYVDSVIPSAAIVSNLFMDKYVNRKPYYIIAGPNYGAIATANLVGPDYNYSKDELQIIEPFGVNCMVYRPGFGTFINANQTAKQTPVSALSKVNVRELVIYLQDEIEKVLQAYQWEFNNVTTRNAILDKANAICATIQFNGGIQNYLNVMDETNNTPEVIDNEMAILTTHIEPGMGCGKMVHILKIYRTGQMSSTVLE